MIDYSLGNLLRLHCVIINRKIADYHVSFTTNPIVRNSFFFHFLLNKLNSIYVNNLFNLRLFNLNFIYKQEI